jgi:hypothetical protein
MSEFWWGLIWLTLFIPFMFLWGFALWDVFSRRDLSGIAKCLWVIAMLFLPLIGILAYFIFRPKELDTYGGYSYAASPYGYPSGYGYGPQYQRASGPYGPEPSDAEMLSRLDPSGVPNDEAAARLKEQTSGQPGPA